jgi:beta-1,4-mannosyl-glycoprotein beta-1,4-N-acetylglucosaminyltransferase
MIVDGFTFFNELDVLELRLTILDEVVDRFVLCESPWTFRGKPKPLVFAEHRDRFARWSDRVVHVVDDTVPDPNPWENEWRQRGLVSRGWADVPDDAIVMISDVDEIPDPSLVRELAPAPGRVTAFVMLLSAGYANRIGAEAWIGTKAMRRGDLGDWNAQHLRGAPNDALDLVRGGWHFSLFGGPQMSAEKMGAYAHSEVDIPYFKDVRRQRAFYDNEVGAWYVPLDERFPPALRDERWSRHVWGGPSLADADAAGALTHAHGCLAYVPADASRIVAVARHPEMWTHAGRERFGDRFAGARDALDAIDVAPGSVVVIDGFVRTNEAALRRLAAAGATVVLYALNARGKVPLHRVLLGASYPEGPVYGAAEYEAILHRAGFAVRRRDDIMDSVFPPSLLFLDDVLDAVAEPFVLHRSTLVTRTAFSTNAYVFVLVPRDRGADDVLGGSA